MGGSSTTTTKSKHRVNRFYRRNFGKFKFEKSPDLVINELQSKLNRNKSMARTLGISKF